MYKYGLVVTVVTDVFEENAAAEERDLQGLNVDIGTVCTPCVGSDGIGHEGGKQAIEVEEEKYGPGVYQRGVSGRKTGRQAGKQACGKAYKMPHIKSSTRYTLQSMLEWATRP